MLVGLERRKVRKGTTSCWNCKRRKVRCIFASETDKTRSNCQRRRAECVTQDLPDKGRSPAIPLGRVVKPGMPTPNSDKYDLELYSGASPVELPDSQPPELNELRDLSKILHAQLPSQEDTNVLYDIWHDSSDSIYEAATKLWSTPSPTRHIPRTLPGVSSHPVLIARIMLVYAVSLQSLHIEQVDRLSEKPHVAVKRIGTAATTFLAKHADLLHNVEGLECQVLEGALHANNGRLRLAWFTIRRAMATAQLVGIHNFHRSAPKALDPTNTINPQILWYKLVYLDRLLSLMLGKPQGSLDYTMGSEAFIANDNDVGRLGTMHTVIAGRILERNEREHLLNDYATTQSIDAELQRAADSMPTKFWLPPSFNVSVSFNFRESAFGKTSLLAAQVYHYNLVNQLHLPFMLSSSQDHKHGYSKITCTNACREILSRFVAFRTYNHVASCCRPLDFCALMAAMTLVLAHLDDHRSEATPHLLIHQRQSDRALMGQVLENMDLLSKSSQDMLSEKSAELVRSLLVIGADAVEGGSRTIEAVSNVGQDSLEADVEVLRAYIPYFGILKLGRGSQAGIKAPQTLPADIQEPTPGTGIDFGTLSRLDLATEREGKKSTGHSVDPRTTNPKESLGLFLEGGMTKLPVNEDQLTTFPGYGDLNNDPVSFPYVAEHGESWPLQGVDMAFFENLTRGSLMPFINNDNLEAPSSTDWER